MINEKTAFLVIPLRGIREKSKEDDLKGLRIIDLDNWDKEQLLNMIGVLANKISELEEKERAEEKVRGREK